MSHGDETHDRVRPWWQEYWPVWLCSALAVFFALVGMSHPTLFFAWHQVLTGGVVTAIVLVSLLRLWVWPKPKPFQLSAMKELVQRARRFWLLTLLLNLVWFAAMLGLGWAWVWLMGPRVWLILLLAALQSVGLGALLATWVWGLPPTLALIWSGFPVLAFSWKSWRRNFVLADQLAAAIAHDLKQPESQMLQLVRVLDHSDQQRLSAGQNEWTTRQSLAVLGKKARDQSLLVVALTLTAILMAALFLGGSRLGGFPPGFEQDQAFQRVFFDQAEALRRSVDGELAEAGVGEGKGTESKGHDASGKGAAKEGADGASSEAADSAASTEALDAGDPEANENRPPSGPNSAPDPSQPGGKDQEKKKHATNDSKDSSQDKSGGDRHEQDPSGGSLPSPDMPGMRPGEGPGDDAGEKNGLKKGSDNQGAGSKGGKKDAAAQGDGKAEAGAAAAKPGDGKGQGDSNPTGTKQPQSSDQTNEGKGSKAGLRELEQGGGGGPLAGRPGAPSPPDPAFQDLVNIEVPPVEAGRLKRLNAPETQRSANQSVRDDAFGSEGQRAETPPGSGQSQQALPNWIWQMLRPTSAPNHPPGKKPPP